MKTQEPIKLMFLMDDFRGPKGGGTEIQFINLLESFDRDRVEPEIAVLRASEYTNKSYKYPFIIVTLNIDKILSLKSLFKMLNLAKKISREKINIVHIYFNDASILAPFFCKLAGAKVIISRRDMGFWYTKFNLICLYISNLFVDHIITNSYAIKSNVNKKEKYPLSKISVIYNGIDTNKFNNIIKGKLRADLGLSINDPIIGMVANFDKIKRHTDLINAFSILVMKHPNVKLVFAGQGPEENSLRELSHRMNLADKIYFLGNVEDVLPIIADIDICVLCSESEGLSNAILEYMGCGKPVICTNAGGNPELIVNGYNGYLIDVGDVATLVDKIQLLLSNVELSNKLGRNGVTSLIDKFNINEMLNSHMFIYSYLLLPRNAVQDNPEL
jgi:L-malate glycosyltransferase